MYIGEITFMHDPFLVDNSKEIALDLQALGFANTHDIIPTARPLYSLNSDTPSGISMQSSRGGDQGETSIFTFNFGKPQDGYDWRLEYVRYSTNLGIKPYPLLRDFVSRSWFTTEGAPPHRERMRYLVERAAKIVAAKEMLLNSENVLNLPSTRLVHPYVLDSELGKQLIKNGYPDDHYGIRNAIFVDDLAVIAIQEKHAHPSFAEETTVYYVIAAVIPERAEPLRIEYVNATLAQSSTDGNLQIIQSNEYWRDRREVLHQLPQKNDLINNLVSDQQLLKVRKVIKQTGNNLPNKGQQLGF